MSQIIINIPDQTLEALQLSPEEFGKEMCLVTAIKLYELGKLSSGAAAEFAGISRVEFLSKLSHYGVNTFNYSQEDFDQEVRLG